MLERRISRQSLIEGWNQDKIDKALIVILGDGFTPRYTSLLASCIELGRTLYVSDEMANEGEKFMGRELPSREVSKGIADIINSLNNNINVKGFNHSNPIKLLGYINNSVDAYFHGGNSFEEKRDLIAHLSQSHRDVIYSNNSKQKTFVLSSGDYHQLRVGAYNNGRITPEYLMPQFEAQQTSRFIGIASSAIGIGEAVRNVLGLGETSEGIITLNFLSRERTSYKNDFSWDSFDPSIFKIGVVGLGAIGSMYLEAIYDLGFDTIYGWDYDSIELTNYARAPHFIGHEGRAKAEVLMEHFKARHSYTKFVGFHERFAEETVIPEVDLLISAVDGYDNQMQVINYSQRNKIPLLLGGCTPFSAVVYAYVPNKISSMLYQYDFLKQAYLSDIRQEHRHCTDPDVEGSNVLTTAFCAAMLAGETINLFVGEPLTGQFRYDMLYNPRLNYLHSDLIRDIGTTFPGFAPLPMDKVTRTIDENGAEHITIFGMPFEEWYEKEGNFLQNV